MIMRSLLLITFTLLITACGAHVEASNLMAPISWEGDSNPRALEAAEKGQLEKPTIVFFHAEWCHVCEDAKPFMDELTQEHQNEVAIIRMEIDEAASRSAVLRYQISTTPTFVLLSAKGNVLASIPGWPGKIGMKKTISQLTHPGESE